MDRHPRPLAGSRPIRSLLAGSRPIRSLLPEYRARERGAETFERMLPSIQARRALGSREQFLDGITAVDQLHRSAGGVVQDFGGVDAHLRVQRAGEVLRGVDVVARVVSLGVGRADDLA